MRPETKLSMLWKINCAERNCSAVVNIQYDFQGPSLHRVAKIKTPNLLTFERLLFIADLSAGLAESAAAIT